MAHRADHESDSFAGGDYDNWLNEECAFENLASLAEDADLARRQSQEYWPETSGIQREDDPPLKFSISGYLAAIPNLRDFVKCEKDYMRLLETKLTFVDSEHRRKSDFYCFFDIIFEKAVLDVLNIDTGSWRMLKEQGYILMNAYAHVEDRDRWASDPYYSVKARSVALIDLIASGGFAAVKRMYREGLRRWSRFCPDASKRASEQPIALGTAVMLYSDRVRPLLKDEEDWIRLINIEKRVLSRKTLSELERQSDDPETYYVVSDLLSATLLRESLCVLGQIKTPGDWDDPLELILERVGEVGIDEVVRESLGNGG